VTLGVVGEMQFETVFVNPPVAANPMPVYDLRLDSTAAAPHYPITILKETP
jgi:hypothetical protein